MKTTISILGCGWLGTALGKKLIRNGYKVKGSVSTVDEYNKLETTGISTFYINAKPQKLHVDYNSFFNTDVLIISIPPKRTSCVEETFPKRIQQIIQVVEEMNIKKVLFISSTSVYANQNAVLSEQDTGIPEKASGKALLKAENLLLQNPNFQTTILRFGGLIGYDRNPARFLQGKNNIPGREPVNLIHRDDCVNIICELLKQDIWGEVFNAVSPDHPTKQEFYTKAAAISELPIPDFIDNIKYFKIISSKKLIKRLNYKFAYPSPLDYLKEIEEWTYRI